MKKRALVVCPGRGTYTKESLGYLRQYGGPVRDFIRDLDERRAARGEPTISGLDGDLDFKPALHTRGENASTLIYACAYADFMSINREKYDIVAITGNSMGWYLTLAFGGSLDWAGGFQVINTMGSMMKEKIIGGQVIYPICDENWHIREEKQQLVAETVDRVREMGGEVYMSILLGGYAVLGADEKGVALLLKELPGIENYPFQLINHAAFHTPLLRETAERAFATIPSDIFQKPNVPLIDGRGCVWQPYSTSIDELYHYTLGHQVVEPYDFSLAISVGLKEFAPDTVILLGPGSTLGGAIGQVMVANHWHDMKSKKDFVEKQGLSPTLLSMGRADQRMDC
ncbi:MAG: ACP S-malonyltransferase [Bdellovibrionales bacterium]